MTIIIVYGPRRDPRRRPRRRPWQKTACILCSLNCGIEVQVEDGHLTRIRGDKDSPRSHGYACEKAQRLDHYQNARDRLTAPLRRRPDGTFEEIDWDTAIREVADAARSDPRRARRRVDLLLRRRRPGQPPRRRVRGGHPGGVRRALHVERARAGEDGRVLGRRAAVRPPALPHDSRLRARRGRDVRRQEPLALARLPALARRPEGDRQGPGPVADRDRPAPHQDRGAGGLPPAGAAGHGRVLPRRAARRAGAGGAAGRGVPGASTRATATRCSPSSSACRSPSTAAAPGSPRISSARSRGGWRPASSVSILEDLGIQQAPHSTLNSYLEKLLYLLTGNFGKPGGDEPAHGHRASLGGDFPRDTRDAGVRRADHHRPGPGQRDPRGDPHRPSRSACGR